MKENKEPIRPITWVIVGIAVVFITSYFGFQLYQGFQQKRIESEKVSKDQQDLLSEQQKALEQAEKKIEDLTNEQKTAQEKAKSNPTIPKIVPETNPQIKIEQCKTESSKQADAMAKYEANLEVEKFAKEVEQKGYLNTGNIDNDLKMFQWYLESIKSLSDGIYSRQYNYYYQTLYTSCLNK